MPDGFYCNRKEDLTSLRLLPAAGVLPKAQDDPSNYRIANHLLRSAHCVLHDSVP